MLARPWIVCPSKKKLNLVEFTLSHHRLMSSFVPSTTAPRVFEQTGVEGIAKDPVQSARRKGDAALFVRLPSTEAPFIV